MSSRKLAGVSFQSLHSLKKKPGRQGLIAQDSAGFLQLLIELLGPVCTAVLEHKLVDTESFVHSIATVFKEAESNCLILGLMNCFPHVTIIDVDV